MSLGRLVLALTIAASLSACALPPPYVRYEGSLYQRKPKAVSDMVVLRGEPPSARRFEDLGTVIVTCPSAGQSDGFGGIYSEGGCNYEWAVRTASQRAANAGADGLHSISSAVNTAGAVVSLTASVFVFLPPRAPPPAPPAPTAPPSETVEDRLKHLDKLRDEQLITPEEYAKTRAEILSDI